ncbi:MAG: redoxin family protein [Gammaproteobacteria bacterium]|nr:redoxin family protein [Gammaproteobacteria bacterium]
MKWLAFLFAFLFSATVISNSSVSDLGNSNQPNKLPEFTHTQASSWINSEPLTVASLINQDKVILIDMWTFDCWNCYRSFPWLNALEEKYQKQGLQIIGVHTPEFEHEKIRTNIEKKVKEFKLHHPVMIDNNFSYWRSLNNRYWPTYYLVNQQGEIVYSHVGETHKGDRKAVNLENKLKELLKNK